jgi:hypothetical protein
MRWMEGSYKMEIIGASYIEPSRSVTVELLNY